MLESCQVELGEAAALVAEKASNFTAAELWAAVSEEATAVVAEELQASAQRPWAEEVSAAPDDWRSRLLKLLPKTSEEAKAQLWTELDRDAEKEPELEGDDGVDEAATEALQKLLDGGAQSGLLPDVLGGQSNSQAFANKEQATSSAAAKGYPAPPVTPPRPPGRIRQSPSGQSLAALTTTPMLPQAMSPSPSHESLYAPASRPPLPARRRDVSQSSSKQSLQTPVRQASPVPVTPAGRAAFSTPATDARSATKRSSSLGAAAGAVVARRSSRNKSSSPSPAPQTSRRARSSTQYGTPWRVPGGGVASLAEAGATTTKVSAGYLPSFKGVKPRYMDHFRATVQGESSESTARSRKTSREPRRAMDLHS